MVWDKLAIISDLMEQPEDSINPIAPKIKKDKKHIPLLMGLGAGSFIAESFIIEKYPS